MKYKNPLFFINIKSHLRRIKLPFLKISLWELFEIYFERITKSDIIKLAASISWSFFLSLFPFLLFLLSILPYMPHYDRLQYYIFDVLMSNVLPARMQDDVIGYIQGNIIPNMKSISKMTIVFALFFATNGTNSIITGFNENTDKQRNIIKSYLIALCITLAFISLILISLFSVYYSEVVIKLFKPSYEIPWLAQNFSKIIGFISFPLFYMLLISLLYWFGCLTITKWTHALPGAIFTMLLFMISTILFVFYVKNIATYNVLYGSIGSILLVMVWVNLNIILILLGNELNLAIQRIKKRHHFNIL